MTMRTLASVAVTLAVAAVALGTRCAQPAEAGPAPSATTGSPARAELDGILARAGRYVVDYGRVSSGLVADESYRQQYWGRKGDMRVRNLRSDIVFVTLPGPIPWTTFRDVYEADGKPVRDRETRLQKLFSESPATAVDQALAIASESARLNLGPALRTVNAPPLALLFLHPDNQPRFSFKRKGRCSVAGLEGAEVELVERTRPTLVRGEAAADVPARGRACVDPVGGAILRTDIEFDMDGDDAEQREWARVVVSYRREARLDAWVPFEMRETYEVTDMSEARAVGLGNQRELGLSYRLEAIARYSDFRRLSAATPETSRPAATPGE